MAEVEPPTIVRVPEFVAFSFLKRPGTGTSGTALKVKTNYFPIAKLPQKDIHHYDVSITPDCPPAVNRRVFEVMIEKYLEGKLGGVRPVYDGRANAFAPQEFPFRAATLEVILPERNGGGSAKASARRTPQEFRVKLRWAASINMQEIDDYLHGKTTIGPNILMGITAIDIVFRNQPGIKFVSTARSFYFPKDTRPLGKGAEVWPGFFQSARPGPNRMLLNVDTSATAFFRSGSLIRFAVEVLQLRSPSDLKTGLPDRQRKILEKDVRNLRIKVTHRGDFQPKFKIMKLSPLPAAQTMFEDADGKSMSVVQYFQQHHNMRLEYPNLPCVTVRKGSQLPMEICEVMEGQRYNRKLSDMQTTEMLKFTTQPPDRRAEKIIRGLEMLRFKENPDLQSFGIEVTERMLEIPARLIPTPQVCYNPKGKDPTAVPRDGVWNLIGKKVSTGSALKVWGVLSFAGERMCPTPQLQAFVRELAVTCQDTGMDIQEKEPPIKYDNPQGDIEQILRAFYQFVGNRYKQRPQMVVCILPSTGQPLYAEIKRVSDTVLGIPTQCLQVKHTKMPKKQYCANVCLKMNVKLGGANSYLNTREVPFISERPTIVMGADVTHPSPGDNTRPSIAALVASLDSQAARYTASIRVQQARTEVIADMGNMVKEVLRQFYVATKGKKPERILFYRDGVSEGMFDQVMKMEMNSIRTACTEIEPGYAPTITFLVVQKRHHTRFIPMDSRSADKSGNCKAGTLIETDIVHPTEFDFYLLSHAGLQGTSRPTHYYVLHDDNKFTADSIQSLTYKMCYLYCRATRAVRVVPAVYYADIMCERARFHTKSENWADTASVESTESDKVYQKVVPELASVMYFM